MNSKQRITLFAAFAGLSLAAVAQETRPFQISFLPNVGTNGNPENRYVNNLSINILAGLNEGVAGVELGSILNLDNQDVKYAQLGGVANLVGGNNTGIQLAGVLNGTKGNVAGVQMAGVTNLAAESAGIQAAGINNVTKNSSSGIQMGGISNFTGDIQKGLQLAGVANYSKTMKGIQMAGVFNHTVYLKGVQFSGVLNQAHSVNGLQLGIINIADTVEKGMTFGLINIVRSGLHQFELSTNDVTDFNLTFRSGTNAFYSILTTGIEGKKDGYWSYGAGFGSRVITVKKFSGTIEATSNTVQTTKRVTDKMSMDNRLSLLVNYQIQKHLTVNGGPVLHVYIAQPFGSTGGYGLPLSDHTFWTKTSSNSSISMWIGYQFGIRF